MGDFGDFFVGFLFFKGIKGDLILLGIFGSYLFEIIIYNMVVFLGFGLFDWLFLDILFF